MSHSMRSSYQSNPPLYGSSGGNARTTASTVMQAVNGQAIRAASPTNYPTSYVVPGSSNQFRVASPTNLVSSQTQFRVASPTNVHTETRQIPVTTTHTEWQPVQVAETHMMQVQVPVQQVQVVPMMQQMASMSVVSPRTDAPTPRPRTPEPKPQPTPRTQTDYQYVTKEVPIDKIHEHTVEREITRYVEVPHDRTVPRDVLQEHVQTVESQVPMEVEKVVYQEIPFANEVTKERVVDRHVIKRVPKTVTLTKEIPKYVDRVITREVPVYVDKEVERVIYREVPVDKVIIREVPVEVEKVVYREVEVPVDKVVEKIVEVPVDRVVYVDKVVYHDKVVYQDRIVEVPVDRQPILGLRGARARQVHGAPMDEDRSFPTREPIQNPWVGSATAKVGLGLVLRRNEEGAIFVKETIQGFAAQRQGGVQPGDVLLQVDGRDVTGHDLDDIKHLTVGDLGSHVLLKLRRGASEVSVQLQRVANEEAAALMRRSYASVESEGLRRSHNSFE